ncbi:MAG: thiamin pyrophosphokinase [Fimbriimonadales bacterium]
MVLAQGTMQLMEMLAHEVEAPVIRGHAYSGAVPSQLLKRLKPGSIAVINIPDFDPWFADQLVASGAAAVVNCAESITGRSPNVGVVFLLERGIPVLDAAGEGLLEELQQGETVSIEGNVIELRGGIRVTAARLTPEVATARLKAAQEYMGLALSKMSAAMSTSITQEWAQFFRPARIPALEPKLRGRLAVVVTAGARALAELRMLRWRLASAAIVAVEGGYEVVRRVGVQPTVVVGREGGLSDSALLSGADIVLLTNPGEETTSASDARWRALGVQPQTLLRTGPAEEAAIAMAADCGARLVLLIGSGFSFADLAHRGERGASAALLTRLRVGSRVMDGASYLRLRPVVHLPTWAYWVIGVACIGLLWTVIRVVLG